MDGKRLNGLGKAMGLGAHPKGRVHDFKFQFVFAAGLEPSLAAMERIKGEQAAAQAEGRLFAGYELPDEDLDMVVRKVYLGALNTNIQMAGGLVPQVEMKCEEIDRRPYVELTSRAREAFQHTESESRGE